MPTQEEEIAAAKAKVAARAHVRWMAEQRERLEAQRENFSHFPSYAEPVCGSISLTPQMLFGLPTQRIWRSAPSQNGDQQRRRA